ncbi:hypothetical protein SAMN04487907_10275 [Zunongwangia mangrovi]|uniref:Uncharacterized protein n=1 Tax=Zunongwangia mangrovi TaxID=1334022 RepID=A0A1I1G793_9FLAO|nr:hypothetical protein [Zunongwangia mangrovi]SFC05243.1 hypothetical protein SAMN04487907_10275 [Zunongwangia mangrovi]
MKAIGITKSLPVDDKNCFISFETEKPMPEAKIFWLKFMRFL